MRCDGRFNEAELVPECWEADQIDCGHETGDSFVPLINELSGSVPPLSLSHHCPRSSFGITWFILNFPLPHQSLHRRLSLSDECWFYAFICSLRITSDQQGIHDGLVWCSQCHSSSSWYWFGRKTGYFFFFLLFHQNELLSVPIMTEAARWFM